MYKKVVTSVKRLESTDSKRIHFLLKLQFLGNLDFIKSILGKTAGSYQTPGEGSIPAS